MRTLSVAILLALTACGVDNDPTFMGVCEHPDGTFTYPADNQVNAACDAPTLITWNHIPITVALDPELADYSDSLDQALYFWNRDLGFALFRRAVPDEAVDVTVMLGSASDPGLAATHHYRAAVLFAVVEYRKLGDITEAYYVLAHEMGHVVDLAHDPQESSIMHASIELAGVDSADTFPFYDVTRNDHDALVQRYQP